MELKNIIKKAKKVFDQIEGAEFFNVQYSKDEPYLILFHCGISKSTLAVKISDFSVNSVKQRIKEHKKAWRAN